jgi:endo-1,4-beta-xylanase
MTRLRVTLVCGLTLLGACSKWSSAFSENSGSLRSVADPIGFYVGSIFDRRLANFEPEYRRLLATEYNSLVSPIFFRGTEPEHGQFNFRPMDRDIELARQTRMKLFGAALIYKASTTPEWANQFARSPERLEQVMKEHIQTLVRHGGDTYYAWEVVNEPLTTPNVPWGEVLGPEEYIVKAFRYAREANPNALLVLNQAFGQTGVDRNEVDRFLNLVKKVKSSGAAIDIAGIEMHLYAQQLRPSYLDEFRYFLKRAREAGVKTEITEMDVYQGQEESRAAMMQQKQIYHDVVSACLEDSNCIGFYTWGVSDSTSWLKTRPKNPLPDAKPLLFDDQLQRKPAYFGVMEALREGAVRR